MKQKLIYTLSVAAALWATTACTDDLGVQDLPVEAEKGYTLKVAANMATDSRMAIENDGTLVNYYWTANDAFTVVDSRHTQLTDFVVDASTLSNKSSNADFIGTPATAYVDGQKLYAVYNKKSPVVLDKDGNVNFDLSGQTGRLSENYQYMWSETTYKDGKPTEFNFRHLVTTLQVKIAVPAGVETLSKVTLYSHCLVSKATLVLNEAPYDADRRFGIGDLVYSYTDNGYDNQSLTLQGTFTPENGYVTLYFYTLSAKEYEDDVTWYNRGIQPIIVFTDQNGLQHASADFFGEKEMEVGAVYAMNVEDTFPLVDYENEAQVDGSKQHPYQIANVDQMYSMMMRHHLNMHNRNENSYVNCNYQLVNDIRLDNRAAWYPVGLNWNSSFDGNGKTISGDMDVYVGAGQVGLFGWVYGSTIKNLTLDAQMNLFFKEHWSTSNHTGMLVGEMQRSTLQHCQVTGSMHTNEVIFGYVGGLVGGIGMSKVEYCGFSGTITSQRNLDGVGGIVGENNSWHGINQDYANGLVIKGCYSDGTFTIDNQWSTLSVGGIIAVVHDPHAVISSCWNATSLNVTMGNSSSLLQGGLVSWVGEEGKYSTYRNCYWKDAVATWAGDDFGNKLTNCETFSGSIPTPAQLTELNKSILASGYLFSDTNGHLVKNPHTVVPPSDIENW